MTIETMDSSVLTEREALGLVGNHEALDVIFRLGNGVPMMCGAILFVDEDDGKRTYKLVGTENQIRFAWDHHGGRHVFAESDDSFDPEACLSQEGWETLARSI